MGLTSEEEMGIKEIAAGWKDKGQDPDEMCVALGNAVLKVVDLIGKASDGTKEDKFIWLTLMFDECIRRIMDEGKQKEVTDEEEKTQEGN